LIKSSADVLNCFSFSRSFYVTAVLDGLEFDSLITLERFLALAAFSLAAPSDPFFNTIKKL
jgi:hypothetical protein